MVNIESIPCLICKEVPWRLVRDHDHLTGYIRGLLCDRCNSYLGTVEWKRKACRKQRNWALKYRDSIAKHLERNTGIKYDPTNRNATMKTAEHIAKLEHTIESLQSRVPVQPQPTISISMEEVFMPLKCRKCKKCHVGTKCPKRH